MWNGLPSGLAAIHWMFRQRLRQRTRRFADGVILHINDEQCRPLPYWAMRTKTRKAVMLLRLFGNDAVPRLRSFFRHGLKFSLNRKAPGRRRIPR